ncbi:MAG: phage portal protein, partial [Anaerolineales bacterium]
MTDINEKLAIGLNELLAKHLDLDEAESYYTGKAAEVFASPQVKKALSRAGSWTLNFSAIPVRAVSERLEILSVKSDTKRSTKVLRQVFTRNRLNIELDNAITDTLVYGHSYLTVAVNHGKVDVFSNSPYGTHAVYRADNPRVMDYAVRLWEEADGTYRANLYTADGIYRFSAHTLPTQVMPQSFDLIGQAPNRYGQIPVFELRTGKT